MDQVVLYEPENSRRAGAIQIAEDYKDYLGQLCDKSILGAPELYWSMIKTSFVPDAGRGI